MMKNIGILSLLILTLSLTGLAACSTASHGPLPKSMKGYELYSWQKESQWRFTLVTGTNRNKNLEEIVSGEENTGADGWVNLRVVGVEAVKDLLNRIPTGEWVTWLGGERVITPAQPADIKIEFPPADTINRIKEYAEQHGLELQIANN
jgi:hypothetical protein